MTESDFDKRNEEASRRLRIAQGLPRFIVDGSDGPDPEGSVFQADGEFPPFVVFDIDWQENVSAEYPTRAAAAAALVKIAAEATDGERVKRNAIESLLTRAEHALAATPLAQAVGYVPPPPARERRYGDSHGLYLGTPPDEANETFEAQRADPADLQAERDSLDDGEGYNTLAESQARVARATELRAFIDEAHTDDQANAVLDAKAELADLLADEGEDILSAIEADDEKRQAVERAVEDATNAGALAIQRALGVQTGDLAGVFFDDPVTDKLREVFGQYWDAEIALGQDFTPPPNDRLPAGTPPLPAHLTRNGYRLEIGRYEDGHHPNLVGRFWWTLARDGDVETMDGPPLELQDAIADAKTHCARELARGTRAFQS